MKQYHDQSIIKNLVKKIGTEEYGEFVRIKKYFIKSRNKAKKEVDKINYNTLPADANFRWQRLYYYQDVIDEMGW